MTNAFLNHSNWPKKLSTPYIVKASKNLLKKFNDLNKGITATAFGFLCPTQGRVLRLNSSISNMHTILNTFNYRGNIITNFEMESSSLYYLGKSLGHNTLTICAVIGNRVNQTQSKNYKETVEKLICKVLSSI